MPIRVLCLAIVIISVFDPFPGLTAQSPDNMGPAIPKEKKLIKWGVDAPDCEEYRARIGELEKLPFDGWVVSATTRLGDGVATIAGQASSTYRFTYDELKHNVESMRAAKSARLTDNFLVLRTAADDLVFRNADGKETGRVTIEHPDWFSDDSFAVVRSNWALMARVAKESGMKGFMLDFEQWDMKNGKYPRPWDYKFLVKHNNGNMPLFQACQTMYRRRGRELAEVVCKVFPDIVFFSYMSLHNTPYWELFGSKPDPDSGLPLLANSIHGLLPAFLDGLLEGIPKNSRAVLIDGGSLYTVNLNQRFIDYRTHSYANNFRRSQVSERAKKRMRLAFAVWVDGRGWRTNPDWSWPWSINPPYWSNQFTPIELEHAFYYALLNSDKYVWVWNEQARFVSNCGWTMKGPANIPADYMAALGNIRKPHSLKFERDLRGADKDPAPPRASGQPGYSDEETFAPLLDKYSYVMDLPTRWRFWADRENISQFLASPTAPDWNFSGFSWRDWGWIETGDYYENLGYRFNGHAWYRTEVEIPASLSGKKLYLHFAGITMNSTIGVWVYVNGKSCPAQADLPRDSTVRGFEITNAVKPGEKNVIVVGIVDYGGPGGIYKRGVRIATPRQ